MFGIQKSWRATTTHIVGIFIQCCVGSLQGNGVGIIEAGLLVIVYDFFLVEASSDRYERCPLGAGCFSVAISGVSHYYASVVKLR